MHRALGAHAGFTVYPPSRTLEPAAQESYSERYRCEARFIPQKKAEVSKRQYSSKAKGFNIHYFASVKDTVLNLVWQCARSAWGIFARIHTGTPRFAGWASRPAHGMSDAWPRPLNARFRSTESAAVDSFENPKIPTPKPIRFTSNENLSKNRFYNQQIANQKRTFVLVPHPARTA